MSDPATHTTRRDMDHDSAAWLAEALRTSDEQAKAAAAAYRALRARGQLASHRVLSYRCPHRCLLVDVISFPSPLGMVIHQPRYKLSPRLNQETSSEAGRRKHTEDGDRRWRERTFPVDQAANLAVTCDHLQGVIELERLRDDLAAGRASVTYRPATD